MAKPPIFINENPLFFQRFRNAIFKLSLNILLVSSSEYQVVSIKYKDIAKSLSLWSLSFQLKLFVF